MPSGTIGKPVIICSRCQKEKKHYAKQMCQSCYIQAGKEKVICERCSKLKTKYAKGLCDGCYTIENRKAKPEIHQKFLERTRKYKDKNREKINKLNRERYYDPEKERIRSREKYLKHKEAINQRNKLYSQNTEGFIRQKHQRRKARHAHVESTLTIAEWNQILVDNNNSCYYCHTPSDSLHQEHKIPLSKGGGYTKENIVPACATCNARKHVKTDIEFLEVLKLEQGG